MATAQLKNTFISVGTTDVTVHPSSLILKLGIARDSIKYFIQSLNHHRIIFFGRYELHHVENDEDLLQRMDKIIAADEALQLKYGKTIIGIDTDYSVIPADFFATSENSETGTVQGIDLFHNSSNPLPGRGQGEDKTPNYERGLMNENAGAEIVFELNAGIKEKLQSFFSGCAIVHINSSLLQVLPSYSEDNFNHVFANIEASYFDIVCFDSRNQLRLMNRYTYKTETDFIYFVLLCCNQLTIDREETELILAGDISPDSELFKLAYKYFGKVSFIQPNEQNTFSRAFKSFPKHSHFNLYNLNA